MTEIVPLPEGEVTWDNDSVRRKLIEQYELDKKICQDCPDGVKPLGRKVETTDCPIYLKSQGKKYSPYIKVTEELCSRCPFFHNQCDGVEFSLKPDE